MCSRMCEPRIRAESQRGCDQSFDSMPGMVHERSAVKGPTLDAVSPLLTSESCCPNCATAERLYLSRKIIAQARAFQTGVGPFDTAVTLLALDTVAGSGSNGGPPAAPYARAAAFSILRI